jgi:bifunctional N-acetylglucosamine-1-phosphate-uridyltransferase/glucosamine-1-phosphate-acetyltransferase GlmU-like protein
MKKLTKNEIKALYPDTIINENVVIYENVSIGSNVFIGTGTTIKENVSIESNVSIKNNVIIENNVFIRENVCIGSNAIIKKGAIIPVGAIIKNGAIIEKGNEGIVINGMYANPISCYFDSNKKEIIVMIDYLHLPIDKWELIQSVSNKFPIDLKDRKKRKVTFEFIKNYALNYNWRK